MFFDFELIRLVKSSNLSKSSIVGKGVGGLENGTELERNGLSEAILDRRRVRADVFFGHGKQFHVRVNLQSRESNVSKQLE